MLYPEGPPPPIHIFSFSTLFPWCEFPLAFFFLQPKKKKKRKEITNNVLATYFSFPPSVWKKVMFWAEEGHLEDEGHGNDILDRLCSTFPGISDVLSESWFLCVGWQQQSCITKVLNDKRLFLFSSKQSEFLLTLWYRKQCAICNSLKAKIFSGKNL